MQSCVQVGVLANMSQTLTTLSPAMAEPVSIARDPVETLPLPEEELTLFAHEFPDSQLYDDPPNTLGSNQLIRKMSSVFDDSSNGTCKECSSEDDTSLAHRSDTLPPLWLPTIIDDGNAKASDADNEADKSIHSKKRNLSNPPSQKSKCARMAPGPTMLDAKYRPPSPCQMLDTAITKTEDSVGGVHVDVNQRFLPRYDVPIDICMARTALVYGARMRPGLFFIIVCSGPGTPLIPSR